MSSPLATVYIDVQDASLFSGLHVHTERKIAVLILLSRWRKNPLTTAKLCFCFSFRGK